MLGGALNMVTWSLWLAALARRAHSGGSVGAL
jgi:hypothetical protein